MDMMHGKAVFVLTDLGVSRDQFRALKGRIENHPGTRWKAEGTAGYFSAKEGRCLAKHGITEVEHGLVPRTVTRPFVRG